MVLEAVGRAAVCMQVGSGKWAGMGLRSRKEVSVPQRDSKLLKSAGLLGESEGRYVLPCIQ